MTRLFEPIRVGGMELFNRIVLAPLTRFRNDDDHIPLPFVKKYYAQRASTPGSFLISEATLISPDAGSLPNVPGIYTDEQISAWKEVTDAVHAKGSYIYMQLWSLGRVARSTAGRQQSAVSSSMTPLNTELSTPRALTESEIGTYTAQYAQAARNAMAAGFDGVEIHGASGYMLDEPTQDGKPMDSWGGSVEDRGCFAINVARAVSDAIGADRTAIRLGTLIAREGMRMAHSLPQFGRLAQELRLLKLAYVHLVESRLESDAHIEATNQLDFFFEAYQDASPVIVAGGYGPTSAAEAVDSKYSNHDVLIAFGRPYISNPDLPFRIKENLPLMPYDHDVFYTPKTPKGYIDYDFSAEFQASSAAAA
ncbi:NADH:flavin oxidoreductase/NADH oxidase [Trichoderma gamsii]|uniref:NADH:flavin oxidoreductase/NADH oxidase n=1 Tax=Trichoderma gamsii TaxID=398673 RepID=A0A2P4ZCW0_9HYPO|nr:NADH:flavin oxidoreductase/NADH oxidase [Trichoderma gamsii]PON22138.1 NADH:flavin oxidoreductase/NADH oxidase [Trichoderma gamsii]